MPRPGRWRGRSATEWLDLTLGEALAAVDGEPSLSGPLAATAALGRALGRVARNGDVILLHGGLGGTRVWSDAMLEEARRVRGVERVVTLFQYLDELPEAEVAE